MDDLITLVLADGDGPGAFFRGPFTDAQYWLSANLDRIRIEIDTTDPRAHRVLAYVPAVPFRQLFPEVPTV